MNESQNKPIPEHIPTGPVEEQPKRPKWFWFAIVSIISGVFAAGILVLRFTGGTFIREVTQEVVIEERGDELDISTFRNLSGLLAPYFELENLKGEKVKISDFLDKPVVITFWTTWNTLSVDQLKILSEVEPPGEVRPLFEVVAINNQEDRSIVSNFIERGGYDIMVLLDESGAVGELYEVRTLPITYFLDKNGSIADIHIGILDTKTVVDKIGEILSEE